jgi:hypothetical protein
MFFSGEMDELRIWSGALSVSTIKDRAVMSDLSSVSGELIAHYPMNAGAGKVLNEQTSSRRHGELHEGIKWVDVSDVSTTVNRFFVVSVLFRALLLRKYRQLTRKDVFVFHCEALFVNLCLLGRNALLPVLALLLIYLYITAQHATCT